KCRHWLKYDFNYNNRVRVGAIGSQDAGEPFFTDGNNCGYDYYSFYFQLKDMGRVENITVGRYKISMGMGLVVNSDFNIGKASMITGITRNGNKIRVHSSRSEADYLQGAAATVRITKGLKANVFASYRPLDATLNNDGTARTIISTGYHRTPTEMDKKNNMHATDAGANLSFAANGLHVGTTVMATHLDRELYPYTSQLYRQYYPAGSDFVNTSADYGYRNHWLTLNGETAMDGHGEMATINSIGVNISDNLCLTLLQRYYSYKYAALHANSFSDGGDVRNESGIYFGGEWKPSKNLVITAYTDYAYFAAPRYRISEASHSSDNMVEATWQSGGWKAGARYRMRLRQRDSSRDDKLIACNTHRIRTYAAYDNGGNWGCRTQADVTVAEYLKRETGWMLTENIYAKTKWMRMDLSAAYFNAESYESRVYAYEKMLPQTFGSLSFFGNGIRYALTARADIGRHFMFIAKIGVTDYFNRSTISSGYQTINASSMADIELQARIKW
ncbi:MAG: helix-hairpin-helix domain-containing protein, partial [Prevotella sp.]